MESSTARAESRNAAMSDVLAALKSCFAPLRVLTTCSYPLLIVDATSAPSGTLGVPAFFSCFSSLFVAATERLMSLLSAFLACFALSNEPDAAVSLARSIVSTHLPTLVHTLLAHFAGLTFAVALLAPAAPATAV